METKIIKLILRHNLTAKVTFGYMDRFIRLLAEFDGQNVTLSHIRRDLSATCYYIKIDLPHGDYMPIINYFKKQKRTEVDVK
jgi:hypothetical protein